MAAAALAAAASGLASCGGSGYEYVTDRESGLYFKVPDHWTVFDEDQLLATDQPVVADMSPQELEVIRATEFWVGFDAAADPTLDRVTGIMPTEQPTGLARVLLLPDDLRTSVSVDDARDALFDTTPFGEGNVQTLLEEDVYGDDGAFGVHRIVNVRQPPGPWVTVDQTIMLDPRSPRLYSLLISCTAECFERERDAISTVTGSWTIEER